VFTEQVSLRPRNDPATIRSCVRMIFRPAGIRRPLEESKSADKIQAGAGDVLPGRQRRGRKGNAPCHLFSSIRRAAWDCKGRAMKLGLMGLKGHQSVVLEGARQLGGVELVAVSDDVKADLEKFKKREALAKDAETYTDWKHLLDHAMMD